MNAERNAQHPIKSDESQVANERKKEEEEEEEGKDMRY